MEYLITQYELEQGALEIQYIEEFFGEFPRKKTAAEIVRRLADRSSSILIASASLPDDPGTVVPVSFKVGHEIRLPEAEPPGLQSGGQRLPLDKLFDEVANALGRLAGFVQGDEAGVLKKRKAK